ncbi:MAG: hypothetical protein ACLQBD_19130 [Syntrophobacteraceae bacterium]
MYALTPLLAYRASPLYPRLVHAGFDAGPNVSELILSRMLFTIPRIDVLFFSAKEMSFIALTFPALRLGNHVIVALPITGDLRLGSVTIRSPCISAKYY